MGMRTSANSGGIENGNMEGSSRARAKEGKRWKRAYLDIARCLDLAVSQ